MSKLDQLPSLTPTREYIVIIICSAKSAYGTSIKYASDANHEIYIVSRVPNFALYLKKLVAQMMKLPRVRFILVNENMNILVDVLHLILQQSIPELILQRREEYLSKYRENLLKISGHSAPSGPEFHVKLPLGHADLPQAFELVILQNCESIDGINYLAEKNVFMQQALRFIALKHGVNFAAVSGIEALINDTPAIVSLSNRLFQNLTGSESVIFKPDVPPLLGSVFLHQFIPIGWDAWSKIMLVARSVPKYETMPTLLASDMQMEELNDIYNDFFSDLRHVSDTQMEQAATDHSGAENLKESKEKLHQLLSIHDLKSAVAKPPISPISYAQFLQSFGDKEGFVDQEN